MTGITEETCKLKQGFLLDVASGRGVLLRQLLKSCHTDVHIISADLSFDVLKYDKFKLKNIAPTVKVSYLACDCTQLPIKDDCLDGVCTFVGIVNMLHLAEKGIGEAARVLKPGASLINACIYMDSNTPGFKNVSKVLRENGSAEAEKILIKEELLDIHKKYFTSLEEKIMYDGIAENSPNDLIPCEGEWFADVVLIAKKGTENME